MYKKVPNKGRRGDPDVSVQCMKEVRGNKERGVYVLRSNSRTFRKTLPPATKEKGVLVKVGLEFSVSSFDWDHDCPLRCSVKGTWA